MKTDLYTKAVLTIIAIALVCIVMQNFSMVTPVSAVKSSTKDVATLNTREYQEVILSTHRLSDAWDPLPVYIVEKPNKKEVTEE